MIIAIELDAPAVNRGRDVRRFLTESAVRLRDAGADLLTIADNPRAEARGDSAGLAILLSREAGIGVMPHLTCRDRNLLALKSAVMTLDLAGLREILIVTGDPFRKDDGGEGLVRSELNSISLARHVSEWNRAVLSEAFRLSAALNVNAPNFDAELRRAERKIRAGVSRFLTQPVLSGTAVRNLARARKELDADLLGGLLPVVSAGNADFLAGGEINGIVLSPKVRALYVGRGRDECARLAVDVSVGFADAARPFVDGFYVITPFNRTDIVEKIVRRLKAGGEARKTVGTDCPHQTSPCAADACGSIILL